MIRFLGILLLGFAAPCALAQDTAADEKPTEASSQAASQPVLGIRTVVEESSAAGQKEEFKAPPGFTTKKRGELVLYCRRDSTVGTRFKTEKCYSEDQVRDYLLTQEENKRNIDRIRSTCGSGSDACVHQ